MLHDLLVSELPGLCGGKFLCLELAIEAFVEFTRLECHSLLSVFVLGRVPLPNSVSAIVTPCNGPKDSLPLPKLSASNAFLRYSL